MTVFPITHTCQQVDRREGRWKRTRTLLDLSGGTGLADQRAVPPPALWPQSLGETIRLLRHRARISRDQLAERAGISAGAVSNYENDVSMPPALTLRRVCWVLADALGSPNGELWEQLGELLDHLDGDLRRIVR